MKKEAIGIAINGREVKIAHMFRDKHRLVVDYMESAILRSDLEKDARPKAKESANIDRLKEEDSIFGVKNQYDEGEIVEEESSVQKNADVLHGLLNKFATRQITVGFNVPPSRVTFQELDTRLDYDKKVFKGPLKRKIENWKRGFNALDNVSIITRNDGTLCNVACDTRQPPIIDMLQQLNTFFKGNMILSLMDPNEISLVNLVRNSYSYLAADEITVIIQIEAEFSRLIFMKGLDLLTVSPLITEGYSPEINNIIYSKIIYELDNLNLSKVFNILISSKASTLSAKSFFEQKFNEVRVGFIVSQPLSEMLSSQYSREQLSDYAIPIAEAWKLIDTKSEYFIPSNLLPEEIIDRQKLLKLTLTAYFLLILLGFSAFFFTYKITAKKIEINSVIRNNKVLEDRINGNQETVKRVQEIDKLSTKLEKRLALSDSLSFGSDQLLSFLERLNQSVLATKTVWINQISNTKTGFTISGKTSKRRSVPELSEALGGAKINKVQRLDLGDLKIFSFDIDVNWDSQPVKAFELEPKTPPFLQTVQDSSTEEKNSFAAAKSKISITDGLDSSSRRGSGDNFSTQIASNNLQQSDKHSIPLDKINSNEVEVYKMEKNDRRAIETTYIGSDYDNQQRISTNEIGDYTIRLSAHVIKLTAKKEVEFYKSKGYETTIKSFPNISRDIPFWVCCGNYQDVDQAQDELEKLRQTVPGNYDIFNIPQQHAVKADNFQRHNNIEKVDLPKSENQKATHEQVNFSEPNENNIVSTNNEENFNQHSPPDLQNYYTISLSAHAIRFTAEKEVESFQKKGYETFIKSFPNSSPEIPYRICYGKFATKEEATAQMQQLKQTISCELDVVLCKY